jgi:hypothetical protein
VAENGSGFRLTGEGWAPLDGSGWRDGGESSSGWWMIPAFSIARPDGAEEAGSANGRRCSCMASPSLVLEHGGRRRVYFGRGGRAAPASGRARRRIVRPAAGWRRRPRRERRRRPGSVGSEECCSGSSAASAAEGVGEESLFAFNHGSPGGVAPRPGSRTGAQHVVPPPSDVSQMATDGRRCGKMHTCSSAAAGRVYGYAARYGTARGPGVASRATLLARLHPASYGSHACPSSGGAINSRPE